MHKPSSYNVIWVKITDFLLVPTTEFPSNIFTSVTFLIWIWQQLAIRIRVYLCSQPRIRRILEWTLCLYLASLRGEERYQIFVRKTQAGRMCGRIWAPIHEFTMAVCFFYLSSCSFMQREEAVGSHPFRSSWWWEESLWCLLLQIVVSRDWNISTWERDSGTTPARAEVPGNQEQLWEFSVENSRCPPGEETNSYPKGASPYIA